MHPSRWVDIPDPKISNDGVKRRAGKRRVCVHRSGDGGPEPGPEPGPSSIDSDRKGGRCGIGIRCDNHKHPISAYRLD